MISSISSHAIAPANVLRGQGAWTEALPLIAELCQKPFVLGRSAGTAELRQKLKSDLEATGLSVAAGELEFDCCEQDLQRLAAEITASGCDAVLAAGGGKVLDAGKLLADRLGLPASRCPPAPPRAGWTALANIYSAQGAFEGDVALRHCPELLIFDHDLVAQAPANPGQRHR